MKCILKFITCTLSSLIFLVGCGGGNGGGNALTPEAGAQTTSESKQVMGFDQVCSVGTDVSIYTVPSGKTFILTDAIINTGASTEGYILRQIGSTSSIVLHLNVNVRNVNLQSGFDFPAGSQILWSSGGACVSTAGYLIASQ